MVAQNSLQYFNCNVTEAKNGAEALEILKKHNFDVILMDIQMPEMDGIEATKIIRNEFKLATPIIALTANAFKTEIGKCKNAGMNDYITKPFDEAILIESIAKHVFEKKPNESRKYKKSENEILYNLNSLNNLSRGNKEFVIKMITIFVNQTTQTIEKIEQAIESNDFIEVSRLVHKIKPSIDGIGVLSISDEIKLLEKIAKETQNKEKIESLFSRIKFVIEQVIAQLNKTELK
jgi:CheY-like chemotaxis protein/HPt (histidine-containing phosphotransfer) domain-containing protein